MQQRRRRADGTPWCRRPGCRGEDLDAVEKTWMPWRSSCRRWAAGVGGGARSDVAKKLRIARAEKGAAVGLGAKK